MENNTLCNRHSLGVNNHTKMYVTYTRIYAWSDYGGESSYQPGYRLENMMWMTLLVYDYIIPGEKTMKFENASIKNLESVEEYVEKLMLSGKIFQREYVEEHIFIGLQRSGQEEIERQNTEFEGIEKYLYIRMNTEDGAFITAKVNRSYFEKAEVSAQEAWGLAEKNRNKESFVMGLAEYMARRFGKCMETMLFLDQTPFYVVTNKSGHKGASAILNKKMLSEFGKKYNINYK